MHTRVSENRINFLSCHGCDVFDTNNTIILHSHEFLFVRLLSCFYEFLVVFLCN